MNTKTLFVLIALIQFSCSGQNNKPLVVTDERVSSFSETDTRSVSPTEVDISSIILPDGFNRTFAEPESFGEWLRSVQIKKDKTVYHFDGTLKANQQAQYAVLNVSVGEKNLQQCADAIMRLRAEYLFHHQRYDEISFIDNEGKAYQFSEPYNKTHLDKYLQQVFAYCGTASLSKQLKAVLNYNDIRQGDVLIRGGFPGHAVIVMDVAVNKAGKKIYNLAQSYMPAQDIHLLLNPAAYNSPWYEISDNDMIVTPEYTFKKDELKRW